MEPGTYFLMREDTETKGPPTRETVVNVTQAEKKSDGVLRLNPRSSTSSFLSRVVGACLAVLLWGVGAQAQDEVATLLNLSPWQSYVHLFCDKTGGADCAVTFRCGQQSGAPVTWLVEVEPSRIFTYWPNKTDGAGRPAGLEAALVNAGLTSPEARRRTTCTVRSDDPVEARAYTFFAGELTPVANIVQRAGDDNKVATLLNLSPWQSYVHLFCDKTGGADCAVTFRCGQQSGAPVTWPVEVEPSRIFTYWPNKTDAAGRPAGLEAALVNVGLTSTEARRRTTCTVRSDAPVKARAYTFIAGQLVPVANVNTVQSDGRQPGPTDSTLSDLSLSRSDNGNPVTLVPPFNSGTTSYEATVPYDVTAVFVAPTTTDSRVGDSLGGLRVNGTTSFSGVPTLIQLTAGQTTTISITVRGSASTTTYRIAVTRQEATRPPTPGSNQGSISFRIQDGCNDGRDIAYKFFHYRRSSSQVVGIHPSADTYWSTDGYYDNNPYTHSLSCTVGHLVCYGAVRLINGRYDLNKHWGVGIEGKQNCPSTPCCWTCTDRPAASIDRRLLCSE